MMMIDLMRVTWLITWGIRGLFTQKNSIMLLGGIWLIFLVLGLFNSSDYCGNVAKCQLMVFSTDYQNHLNLSPSNKWVTDQDVQYFHLAITILFLSSFPVCFIPTSMFCLHLDSNKCVLTEWCSFTTVVGNVCMCKCRILS